jgi:hypothetical protein
VVYVISKNSAVSDVVRAALKTSAVIPVGDSAAFLQELLPRPRSKEACVIIDLATVADPEHIITFIKSSPSISPLPIVVVGSEDDINALPHGLHPSINGIVSGSYTAGEIAAVIASISEQRLPDIPPPR